MTTMRTFRATRTTRIAAASVAAGALALGAAACSSGSSGTGSANGGATSSTSSAAASGGASGTAMADAPFGSACATVPATGAGSFDGMAQAPVATAASNNPALSTLVTAVKAAGLVDTLNSAQNITVFAPDNAAFAKLPKATLDKVLADKAMLTKILTYHVVGQKLTPAQLGSGSYPTLEKQSLTTAGSGTSYTVNGTAKVVCGNVRTANANVEIIDTVLMPPS
ncbi:MULTISPECIES: fasciclin domain-containing protein [Streptacidiphilus]|uniref:Fasciclin domain-containing protein n=1 Tax=Streptacidiphilus cavernicola TaxID=3342716 RepID=A0ABV6UTP6_9ACTN|nr:fasciclin domain-containing protein [Streptacidiphilus jeojiense]